MSRDTNPAGSSSTGRARTFFTNFTSRRALARQVKKDDLSPDDIIIMYVISPSLPVSLLPLRVALFICSVMGPSGSGKSSVSL